MLRLLLGRSGSGKTFEARRRLCHLAEEGREKLMLLVPEQYSFESERAMLRLLGAGKAPRVEVYSFTRLADAVFRAYGSFAGERLDEGGKVILMSLALEAAADGLELYRRQAPSPEFLQQMLAAGAELKLCGIPPEELSRAALSLEDGVLRRKARETGWILSCYDALAAQGFSDPLDDLDRARALLEEHPMFAGYTIAVDSFKSFTGQELRLLELLLRQCAEMTVTLCADALDDPEQGAGLFSPVKRSARQILRLARRNGIPAAPPEILPPGARFHSAELKALEASLYRPARAPFAGPPRDVRLFRARDRYEEAALAAAGIRRLVMEEGYRYREIAVIVRAAEPYDGCLDAALEHWEIPYFMDRRKAVDAEPLTHLALSAFDIVTRGWETADLLAYLKTGLCGFSTEEIAELENYAYLWRVNGKRWREPWTDNPAGFSEHFTERDREELARLNALRERLVRPLERFRAAVGGGADGERQAEAVYRLLEELDAAGQVRALRRRLLEGGRPELADRQAQLWDLLMKILDQTALALRGRQMEPSRYAELLRLVIRSSDVASIPQGLDEVTVAVAGRMRLNEPRAVFVLGACQGEFPQTPSASGVFSDAERKTLISLGLPLADPLEGVALEERFLAYAALTGASERLVLSYPAADLQGAANAPSSLVAELQAIFPALEEEPALSLPPEDLANAREPAFVWMASQWGQQTAASAALREFFSGDPRVQALERAAAKTPFRFADPAQARALFDRRSLSATQVETYHLCRFQYFCRYGLGVKPLKPAELDALEYGTLMHFLLERLLHGLGSRAVAAMSEEELLEQIRALVSSYAENRLGGESKSPRVRALLDRLADSACAVVAHVARELSQSGFSPAAFEAELREGGAVPPLRIRLPGRTVVLEGKIDRIDLAEINGETYVRIIDYKTGKREFRLSDVLCGVNLQMLLYLAAVIEQGGVKPAGILYMPAARPQVAAERGESAEKIRREAERGLRMNGLLVDDPQVLLTMEPSGGADYIPVSVKNGAAGRSESAVSAQELERVLRAAKRQVKEMAETLDAGGVEAAPLKGDADACRWCPYFPVCGHEEEDGGREYFRCKKSEALARLEKEENGEGGQP